MAWRGKVLMLSCVGPGRAASLRSSVACARCVAVPPGPGPGQSSPSAVPSDLLFTDHFSSMSSLSAVVGGVGLGSLCCCAEALASNKLCCVHHCPINLCFYSGTFFEKKSSLLVLSFSYPFANARVVLCCAYCYQNNQPWLKKRKVIPHGTSRSTLLLHLL